MTEPSVTMYYGYDFKAPRERKRGRMGGGGVMIGRGKKKMGEVELYVNKAVNCSSSEI